MGCMLVLLTRRLPAVDVGHLVSHDWWKSHPVLDATHTQSQATPSTPPPHVAKRPLRRATNTLKNGTPTPSSRFKTEKRYNIPVIPHLLLGWYVITGNENYQRRENVDAILTKFPWIQKMQGNNGFDEACVELLRFERIRVSPTYYDGSGKIHAGKIGHWCSFLTFLQRIGTQGVGVWIEDDVVLQSWKDIDVIQDAVSQASNAKPLQRFSHADGLLVVRNDPQLWQPLRERGITNPTDLLYAKLGLYDVKHKAILSKLTNVQSTITSTSLLEIQDVNSRLDGKASTTH